MSDIMGIFVGIAVVLIVFSSTSVMEKRLKSIENQNKDIVELLKEIKNEK